MTLASLAAILQTTLVLLSTVAAHPELPQSSRDNAIRIAQSAINETMSAIKTQASAKQSTASNYDVFIIAGGTNAAGIASAGSSFTAAYVKNTGRQTEIVPAGVNGSALLSEPSWNASSTAFQNAVSSTKRSLETARSRGLSPRIAGIIWSEGEAEGAAANKGMDIEAAYTSALASLVSRFRTSLYAPEIPLYIVQTGNEIHADDGGYGHVRAAQESVAKTLPHAYIVSRESVAFPATGMQRSGSEFIPAGYQQLATVAADNIARLQKGEAIRTGEAQGLYSVTGIAPRTLEFIGFVNEANSCTASQYSLEYGDGNIFPIQVSKNTCGPYAFITTHAYTAPGMYSVSLKDTKGALLQKSPYSVE